MDSCNERQSPLALTELEKSRMVETILRQIEQAKEGVDPSKDSFSAMTEQEIREALNRVNTPFISYQIWTSATVAGGSIGYTLGIFNPDPVSRFWMYVHAFIGPANMVPDTGIALLNVDTRFPRLTEPSFAGLTLAPATGTSLNFTMNVPAGIQPSNYLGNSFLFHGEYHNIGTYYSRSFWPFRVN